MPGTPRGILDSEWREARFASGGVKGHSHACNPDECRQSTGESTGVREARISGRTLSAKLTQILAYASSQANEAEVRSTADR